MKILIALNFAVGIALVAVLSLPDPLGLLVMMLGMVLVSGFLFGLPIANLVYVFITWKRERGRSFIPLASYCAAFLLAGFLGLTISDIVLKGTPCRPDSFFDTERKRGLTEIAIQVLDDRRRGVLHGRQELGTNYGGLKVAQITNQQFVVFNYWHGHSWFEYIYAPNGSTNQLYFVDSSPIRKNLGDDWYFRSY